MRKIFYYYGYSSQIIYGYDVQLIIDSILEAIMIMIGFVKCSWQDISIEWDIENVLPFQYINLSPF